MNVLVVGGTRFLGIHLTGRLLAAGHAVTLFNRGTRSDAFGDRVQRLRGDRTAGDVRRLLRGKAFDAVVDLAAYRGEETAEAAEALAAGHYVFVSSGQVYLLREGCPSPAREEDYGGPLIPEPAADEGDHAEWEYGMGKRAAEDALAEAWEERRFPATSVRIPMVNGPGDHRRRLESYLWRLLDGGPLLLPDGGAHPARHVYVGDVARAIVEMLGRADTFGRAYNLCQRETPTVAELLAMLADQVGARPRLVPIPSARLLDVGLDPMAVSPFSTRWMSLLDPGRAERELGFRPTPLADSLRVVVDAFLAAMPAVPPPGYSGRERERETAGRSHAV